MRITMIGAGLAAVLTAQTHERAEADDLEIALARYARVEEELRAADVSGLTPDQRSGRMRAIEWLHEYRLRGDLGRNVRFPDERTPLFVDDDGRRCAVAFLLDRSGQVALVEEIAAKNNHAWLVELAGDPRLRDWLHAHGLSLPDAARIQGPGIRIPSFAIAEEEAAPPRWRGPEDVVRSPRGATGTTGRRQTVQQTNATASRTATGRAPRGALLPVELDWQAWWRANRVAHVQRDRATDTATTSVRLSSARESARAALLPELAAQTRSSDAHLRAAATLTLGRLGGGTNGDAHVALLRERLADPQQGIRYLALLGLGALGTPRASFELATVAGQARTDRSSIGPEARAFAVLGLALARNGFDDGFVRVLVEHAPAHRDDSLRMAALLYADLADPEVFADLAERLQDDRDLLLRARALESLGGVPTDEAVATLTRALSGRHRDLRRSAALALGQSAHPLALPALQTAHDLEREHLTRGVILLAIGGHPQRESRTFLMRLLERGAKAQRPWAALGLGLWLRHGGDAEARAALRTAMAREKNDSARPAYALACGLARDTDAVAILEQAMRAEGEAPMRLAAGDALALIGDDAARAVLRAHVQSDPCPTTRAAFAELLVGIGTSADVDAVLEALVLAENDAERAKLLFALGVRFLPKSFARLRQVATDGRADPRLRAAAVHSLGRMLDADSAHRFAELSRHSNWQMLPEWLDWLVQSTL